MSIECELPQADRQTLCPICTRGKLVLVAPNVWDCERKRCNNQFFYSEWEDSGLYALDVRDKPWRPILPAPASAGMFGVRLTTAMFGVLVMYIEGQHQPSPGVWFVVAMALIVISGIPRRKESKS